MQGNGSWIKGLGLRVRNTDILSDLCCAWLCDIKLLDINASDDILRLGFK